MIVKQKTRGNMDGMGLCRPMGHRLCHRWYHSRNCILWFHLSTSCWTTLGAVVCVCGGGVKSVSCTMLFIDSPLAMPSGPPTPRHTQWTGPGLHMCEILQHAGIIHVQAPKLEPKQGQYASSGCCKGLSDSIDDNRQCPLKRSQCLRKNLQTTKWPH